ncbi:MAG: hypothetical protein R6U91_01910 [Bacillota bacterium]
MMNTNRDYNTILEVKYWIPKLYEMEEKHLPDLDHKDCGCIADLFKRLLEMVGEDAEN